MAPRILPIRKPGRPLQGQAPAAETREHLLTVARQIVAEKGFGELSLREIASRARVNPALLNYYFGSLDGLQKEMVEDALEAIESALDAIERSRPVVIQTLVDQLGGLVLEKTEMARFFASDAFTAENPSAKVKKTRDRLTKVCLRCVGGSAKDAELLLALTLSVLCAPRVYYPGTLSAKEQQHYASVALLALRGVAGRE